MKKILLTLSVLLFSVAALFAAQEMNVTWQWLLDDPEVQYYRYQLDGTLDDGWTVVSADISEYTATGLDPYSDHTLYLERSYDAINWSETASSTAEALLVLPVEEEVVPAEEEAPAQQETAAPVITPAEETAVLEPAALDPVAVADEDESRFAFSLLMKGSMLLPVDYENFKFDPYVGATLSFDFANIITVGDNFGFGLRWDIEGNLVNVIAVKDLFTSAKEFFDIDNYDASLMTALMFTADVRAGFFNLNLGVGGGAGMYNGEKEGTIGQDYKLKDFKIGDATFQSAAFVQGALGMRFYMGSCFSLGLEGVYRFMLPSMTHVVDAGLVMGFTF